MSGYKSYIASDLDGVICEDEPTDKSADAKPLFVPSYPLVAIITDRLEKYREETQRWLNKNNVKYDRLFMAPNARAESTALHKIAVLRKLRPPMYIKSDEALAEKDLESLRCSNSMLQDNEILFLEQIKRFSQGSDVRSFLRPSFHYFLR
jgi:hypothetical protein